MKIDLVLEDQLTKEHNVKFIPAEDWKIPEKVKISYFVEFLQMPYVIDDFKNHIKRTQWIYLVDRKHEGFRKFYSNNALKKSNKWIPLSHYARKSFSYEDSERLLQKTAISIQKYDEMDCLEKVDYVKVIKNELYRLLKNKQQYFY